MPPSDLLCCSGTRVADTVDLVNPDWLLTVASRKFRQSQCIGAPQKDVCSFLDKVTIRAARFNSIKPVECSRIIIDVDTKEHVNMGDTMDEIEIKSLLVKGSNLHKRYRLDLGPKWTLSRGRGIMLGTDFFNTTGFGQEISLNRTPSVSTAQECLGQEYGIVGKVSIPPMTKVMIKITTWAVTYSSEKIRVNVQVPSWAKIPVMTTGCMGGRSVMGYVYASDIFRTYDDFSDNGNQVTFCVDGYISYLSESATIEKFQQRINLPPSEDMLLPNST